MRPSIRTFVFIGTLALLAACGRGQPEADAPRPALVVHPGALDLSGQAFAGDVRARQESPLSFQIGGHLVRRLVDMGARVKGRALAELDRAMSAQVDAALALTTAQADPTRAGRTRSLWHLPRNGSSAVRNSIRPRTHSKPPRVQRRCATRRPPTPGRVRVCARRPTAWCAAPGQAGRSSRPDRRSYARCRWRREVQISIPEQRMPRSRLPAVQVEWTQRQIDSRKNSRTRAGRRCAGARTPRVSASGHRGRTWPERTRVRNRRKAMA